MAEDPAKYQWIIDRALAGPVALEGKNPTDDEEQGWLLDDQLWLGILRSIPNQKLGLQGVQIGGMPGGWLNAKAKPPLVAAFASKPIDVIKGIPGKNSNGLLTYQGGYLLWRHAIHYSHNQDGGGDPNGPAFDAMEAFKLWGALVDQLAEKLK
jgi:hypothetical protein